MKSGYPKKINNLKLKIIKIKKFLDKIPTKYSLYSILIELAILLIISYLFVTVPYLSIFPMQVITGLLISSLILGLLSIFLKDRFLELLSKFFLGLLIIILSIQIIQPVFKPKVSISEVQPLFGEITTQNGQEKHYIVGSFEVKVKPPLFPFDNSVRFPVAFTNLTSVRYEKVTPMFSQIILEPNIAGIKFHVYGDAWSFEEYKAKIIYKGDTYPRLNVYMSDFKLNPPTLINYVRDGKEYYFIRNSLYNYENYQVCLKDFEFNITKTTFSELTKTNAYSFSISICDNFDFNGCMALRSSINGNNFSQPLFKSDLLKSDYIILKTWNYCLDSNSSKESFLVFMIN